QGHRHVEPFFRRDQSRRAPRKSLDRDGRSHAAFADLVVGREQDRLGGRCGHGGTAWITQVNPRNDRDKYIVAMVARRPEHAVPAPLPLIEAKLAVPRIRAGVVSRARLFADLDTLSETELTLVSGPAGSGKTVLVSSWLAVRPD